MKKIEVIYLAISADKFEFPLVVCDTLSELASWADLDVQTIRELIQNRQIDTKNMCRYLRLKICVFINLQKNNPKNKEKN